MNEIRKKTQVTATLTASVDAVILVHARIIDICTKLGITNVAYRVQVKHYGGHYDQDDMSTIYETYKIVTAMEIYQAKERGLELTYVTPSISEENAAELVEQLETLHIGPAVNE